VSYTELFAKLHTIDHVSYTELFANKNKHIISLLILVAKCSKIKAEKN